MARLGGDEFALLAVGAGREAAVARAEEALAAMRRPMAFGNQAFTARASIGVALAPEHDRAPGELVKDADLALYAAKQSGRDRLVVYEPALRTGFEGRIQILRETADALDAHLIEPHYQPKVRLDTGALIGFEALARWRHPERGLLTPGGVRRGLRRSQARGGDRGAHGGAPSRRTCGAGSTRACPAGGWRSTSRRRSSCTATWSDACWLRSRPPALPAD